MQAGAGTTGSGAMATGHARSRRSSSSSPADVQPADPTSSGYRFMAHWQFAGLKLVLGSDLLVFRNQAHPNPVAVTLAEIGKGLSREECLDLYLDNLFTDVPELVVCYHDGGRIQGYQLVSTSEIPLLSGDDAPFSASAVEQGGAALLQFLRHNCTKDCSSYWLVKRAGQSLVELYDMNTQAKQQDSSVDSTGAKAVYKGSGASDARQATGPEPSPPAADGAGGHPATELSKNVTGGSRVGAGAKAGAST